MSDGLVSVLLRGIQIKYVLLLKFCETSVSVFFSDVN